MSENYKRLDAVEKKIEALLKKKTQLRKKERKGQLNEDEEIELKGVERLLTELKRDKERWFRLVEQENQQESKTKSFGEADGAWIASVTGVDIEYRRWTTFISEQNQNIIPSPEFREQFENVSKAFHMRTEAGRRIFLNLFLSNIVLREEFKNELKIFPKLDMEVQSNGPQKRGLKGKTDYTVGFGKNFDIFSKTVPAELHLVAVVAKRSIGEDDFWQCVAETATLFKSRKDAKKAKCAVWGVLSNATNWKFIHIDEKGKLWQSDEIFMNIRSYNEEQVAVVYRLLYYVINCCYEARTPNPAPTSSTTALNE